MSAPESSAIASRIVPTPGAGPLARMWRSTVSFFTGLALLGAATMAAGRIAMEYRVLVTLVLALVFCLLASLAHELGHAFAAWLIDWDIHVVDVARLSYLPARRAFGRVPIEPQGRLGGYVFATPARLEDWSSGGHALFVLGGVIANLFAAALCQIAALRLAASWPMVAALCVGFGLTSLILAVSNLVPVYRDAGRDNDGAQLLDILLGRKLPVHRRVAARMSGLTIDRVPAKDWPPALMAGLEAAAGDPRRFAVLTSYYLSVGAAAKALAALRQVPPSDAAAIESYRAVHAFLVALVERDAAAARAILTGPLPQDFGYWRAMAVILAIEGRQDDARAAVAAARKAGMGEAGGPGDDDDAMLLAAIEEGRELPTQFGGSAP